jgi:hypothetical protein
MVSRDLGSLCCLPVPDVLALLPQVALHQQHQRTAPLHPTGYDHLALRILIWLITWAKFTVVIIIALGSIAIVFVVCRLNLAQPLLQSCQLYQNGGDWRFEELR